GPGAEEAALRATFAELAKPVVHAAVTTALGFLSLAFSPLPAVQVLGLSMTVGVLLCLLWSLTVLPAPLALLGAPAPAPAGSGGGPHRGFARLLERWTRRTVERPALALMPVGALAVAAILGAARVRVQDSWIEGLSPGSDLRLASAHVDELFGGTHLLRVRLDVDGPRANGAAPVESLDERSALLDGVLADPPSKLLRERFVVKPVSAQSGKKEARPLV